MKSIDQEAITAYKTNQKQSPDNKIQDSDWKSWYRYGYLDGTKRTFAKQMYFIHEVTTYKPANKKCKLICDFVLKFKQHLIEYAADLAVLHEELEIMIKVLNDRYPNSKRVVIHYNDHTIYFKIEGSIDQHAAIIHIKQVLDIYGTLPF
ncbi:MAG: hypothetical protein ACRC3Z_11045 [Phocaeicola sp.]